MNVCVFICIVTLSDMTDSSSWLFLKVLKEIMYQVSDDNHIPSSYLGDLTFESVLLKQYEFTDLHDK